MKSEKRQVTLFDCTLRDGGYYTNWNFDLAMVSDYFSMVTQLGIDYVELGYMRFDNSQAGPFGNIPEQLPSELLDYMLLFPELNYAVMIDFKELVKIDCGSIGELISNRINAVKLPIKLIRIAVHYNQIQAVAGYVNSLQAMGFDICINLMQIDMATASELEKTIQSLTPLSNLSALYFADSLGSMMPEKLIKLIHFFRMNLDCPIGFHAHDNIGLALHNSLTAVNAGVSWLDGTIYGMGRGAGNARLEQLISFYRPTVNQELMFELYEFIATYFHKLRDEHNWGSNVLYGVSALGQLHPSYAQSLEKDKSLSIEKKLQVLYQISQNTQCARSYDVTYLRTVITNC